MKKHVLVLLALMLLASFAVYGCTPKDTVAQDLIVAIGAEPENLDPLKMSSAPAATVAEHMVENLIYLDVDGDLKPSLATSWEAAADGKSWTLNLREGVKFHDGTPFNADAVKFNLDRFMGVVDGVVDPAKAAAFSFLLGQVSEIEVVSEYVVRVHLKNIFAPILSHLSHSFIGMHSPASLTALPDGEFVQEPVGTGPFKFVKWDRGEQIVMEKNKDYWGDVSKLDTVTFKFVPDAGARVMMLEAGEVHAIMAVPPVDIARLQGNADIDVVFENSVRVIYLGFNLDREIFKDVKVRQALNHAIDKDVLIKTLFQGVGEPSSAPVVPAIFGYTKVGPYEYNVAKAKQLLADAGYADGFEIELYHPTGRYPQDAKVAEAVQAMLKDVGVTATLKTLEWATYVNTVRSPAEDRQDDIYMLGWGTVTLDADYGLYALLHSSQWPTATVKMNNAAFYNNAEVDALLDQARTTPDRTTREGLYKQAIEKIWDDAPWIYLHNEGQVNAVRKNVKGLIHHPLENILAWKAHIE